jgi:hypothetical protein
MLFRISAGKCRKRKGIILTKLDGAHDHTNTSPSGGSTIQNGVKLVP